LNQKLKKVKKITILIFVPVKQKFSLHVCKCKFFQGMRHVYVMYGDQPIAEPFFSKMEVANFLRFLSSIPVGLSQEEHIEMLTALALLGDDFPTELPKA
jgi:hypothetical protein